MFLCEDLWVFLESIYIRKKGFEQEKKKRSWICVFEYSIPRQQGAFLDGFFPPFMGSGTTQKSTVLILHVALSHWRSFYLLHG